MALVSITILLDQPAETDDAFELVSADGSYRKVLQGRLAKPLVAGKKLLRFDGVDPSKSYRLVHRRSKLASRTVLPLMPVRHMTEAGHGPRDSEHTYLTLASRVDATLTGRYGGSSPVDPVLIASSPVLLDLKVEDPKV